MVENAEGGLPVEAEEVSEILQSAGVAGAGGAGFPSYVKWAEPDTITRFMINHQESEPNYYADKWLGRERAPELGETLTALSHSVFDEIVVGTKQKYRDGWTSEFEVATDATIVGPEDLPLDTAGASDITFVYTPDVYTYSEENVLLMVTTGTQIGDDLPTDHGWVVHNTETLFNISQALYHGKPVTHKYVHVDGNTPAHRCLEVPIGTTATDILTAAGVDDTEALDGRVLADGGPGWCYEIEQSADEFGVRKRTNAILVLDEDCAVEHTEDDGQINVLDAQEWNATDERPHEMEPTRLSPDRVRIPLITNEAYTGLVRPSVPVVDVGSQVEVGDIVARPDSDGISNTQHASIKGTVTTITDTHVVIEQ